VQQELLAALDEEEARLTLLQARWEEGMAAIEHYRRRVEQEDPDRGQLSDWRQELIQELLRTGVLREIQGFEVEPKKEPEE
jgi:hypothetical protein